MRLPPMPVPTILVCDDDPGLRLLVRLAVEPRGYRVLDARDGTSCIALAERMRPDLVLIDANLPDMSGSALVAGLRADPGLATIPLLVATASPHALEHDGPQIDGVLVKPFALERLVAEIERLLTRGRLRSPGIGLRRVR